jgi:hypothetical protein
MPDTAAPAAPPVAQPGQPAFFELSRLMVVAINGATNQLMQIAQVSPNGPWASGFTPMVTGAYALMTSGITRDGRVAVIAAPVGQSDLVYIDEEANQQPGVESWNSPVSIHGPPNTQAYVSLAMSRDVDGRIEVFAVPDSGQIWWSYQNPDQLVTKQVTVTPPGTTTPIVVTVQEMAPPSTPWSDWIQIPGGLVSIKSMRQGDGRIALFGINSNGQLYRCVQNVAAAFTASDWSGWVEIDDNFTGKFAQVELIVGPMGSLHAFGLTQSGQIYHTKQVPAASDTWTPWTTIGFTRTPFNALAVGIDGDGHILVAASDTTKVHSFNSQTNAATGEWTGWREFANSDYPVVLALDYNADGRLTLFSHWIDLPPGPFGGLWTISQSASDSTEWTIQWNQLAGRDILQFQVVRDLTPPA